MKGLILKDLYLVKSFGKHYISLLLFMAVWGVVMKAVAFLCIYSILLGAMVILSVIALDDAVFFNRFALTMPISERTLIKSKYFLFVITIAVGAVIAGLISGISTVLPFKLNQNFDWNEIMPSVTVMVVGTAIAFPVILRKGAEKGRYVYMAAMLGMGGIIYAAVKLCLRYNISLDALETVPVVIYGILFAGICVISLVISYLVSVRMVQNKEW